MGSFISPLPSLKFQIKPMIERGLTLRIMGNYPILELLVLRFSVIQGYFSGSRVMLIKILVVEQIYVRPPISGHPF